MQTLGARNVSTCAVSIGMRIKNLWARTHYAIQSNLSMEPVSLNTGYAFLRYGVKIKRKSQNA